MKTINEYINEQNNEQRINYSELWIDLKNARRRKYGFMIYVRESDTIEHDITDHYMWYDNITFESYDNEKECESYYRALPELDGLSKKLFRLRVGQSLTWHNGDVYDGSIYTRIW